MNEGKMLSQAEIDALLAGTSTKGGEVINGMEESPESAPELPAVIEGDMASVLDDSERDALGEIGNISMGSASTTLSELLRQKVVITSPKVSVVSQKYLFDSFNVPYVVIKVDFKSGLDGINVLVIKLKDAMIMASLMMGGDGEASSGEISEIELSAASEAMNQMIGTASTSLSTMFGRTINISPPVTTLLEKSAGYDFDFGVQDDNVVVISFDMKIGNLVDTEIMQVLSIDTAKNEAALLWENLMGAPPPAGSGIEEHAAAGGAVEEEGGLWFSKERRPNGESNTFPGDRGPAADLWPEPVRETAAAVPPPAFKPSFGTPELSFPGLGPDEQKKLELLLEVPLKVSVVLGRTRRPIKEVLNLTPGAIVELNSLVDEPVEVLVNGTLVAKGEVVVVNENFGVRIVNIISPEDRLRKLKEK